MSTEIPESVSIVIRNKNEGKVVESTLEMLKSQDYEGQIEYIVIDSGSTDCSIDIIKKFSPDVLHIIKPEEYIPGKILNWGMEKATNEWVVFLNSDATPVDNSWLRNLLKAGTENTNFGAAFCRQVCREDAWAAFKIDYDKCFGPERISDQWEHFFSMVSSMTCKKVWTEHKFDEDLQYSEDEEWSRRLKKNGLEIVYAENAQVIHSHNYTFKQTIKRSIGEMTASLQMGSDTKGSMNYFTSVLLSSIACWLKEIPSHFRYGKVFQIPRTLITRYAQRYGKWKANNS